MSSSIRQESKDENQSRLSSERQMLLHHDLYMKLLSAGGKVPVGPEGVFTCSRCGNSYARPHSLNRHLRFECGEVVLNGSLSLLMSSDIVKSRLGDCGVAIDFLQETTSVSNSSNVKYQYKQYEDTELNLWLSVNNSSEDKESCNYRCEHCGKSYLRKRTLSRHRRYDCGTEPRFTCSLCGVRVRRRYALTGHLMGIHGIDREQAESCIPAMFHKQP
uniref:C2H2-type domain-containing protein n=1 Tax=Timema tahoe TaxID=61484 RepID=A0A7R9ILZ5_9NEOP|nr:unnamed protein product [Timema tahoe]